MSGLDGAILDEFTQGMNAPSGPEDAGKIARVTADGINLEYVDNPVTSTDEVEEGSTLTVLVPGDTPQWVPPPVWGFAQKEFYQPVPIGRYLSAGGNIAQAIVLAAAANPTAEDFEGPVGEHAWPTYSGAARRLTKADGLRSNMRFDMRRTRLYRDYAGATPSGLHWFYWAGLPDGSTDNDRIAFIGGRYDALNIGGIGGGAGPIGVRGGSQITLDGCEARATSHASLSGDGTRWVFAMSGSRDSSFTKLKLDGAQLAVVGLGFSSRGTLIDGVQAKNANDFAISACSGGVGQSIVGLQIKNVDIDGIMGAGGLLLGNDGEVTPMDALVDVTVDGVSIRGARSSVFGATSCVGIRMFAGTLTRGVHMGSIRIALDDGEGMQGLHIRGLPGTDMEDITLDDVLVDMRANTGSTDAVLIDAVAGRGCTLSNVRGRSGRLTVRNLDHVKFLKGCEVHDSRIDIGPTTRDVDQYLIESCYVNPGAAGSFPVVCSATGTRSLTNLLVAHSWLQSGGSGGGGHASVFADMNGGSFTWRAKGNVWKGSSGPNAEAAAGLIAAGSHNNEVVV